MYTHDILKPHHDKDYRAIAAFPVEALGNRVAGGLQGRCAHRDHPGNTVEVRAARRVGPHLERAYDASGSSGPTGGVEVASTTGRLCDTVLGLSLLLAPAA